MLLVPRCLSYGEGEASRLNLVLLRSYHHCFFVQFVQGVCRLLMYMTPAFRLARHRIFQENASGRSSWTNLEANVSNVLHCMVGLGCIAKVRKSSREGTETMCGIR